MLSLKSSTCTEKENLDLQCQFPKQMRKVKKVDDRVLQFCSEVKLHDFRLFCLLGKQDAANFLITIFCIPPQCICQKVKIHANKISWTQSDITFDVIRCGYIQRFVANANEIGNMMAVFVILIQSFQVEIGKNRVSSKLINY